MKTTVGIALTALALGGCGTQNAYFVTKTSLSVLDVDSTPASASLAFDRTEGYAGPRLENGTVYPVVAYLQSNGGNLMRTTKQAFAGGKAADLVVTDAGGKAAAPDAAANADCGDERERPPLLFATGTTIGLKIGVTANAPSVVLGYRRKEAAVVPVSARCQPSVLATLDTDLAANATSPTTTSTGSTKAAELARFNIPEQYFATGSAAETLAAKPSIRRIFERKAELALDPVNEFNQRAVNQRSLALDAITCSLAVPDPQFPSVLVNAEELGLFPDPKDATFIRSHPEPAKQRALYRDLLPLKSGETGLRGSLLELHKQRVCQLATS